jgi:hypothetical protein
VNADAIADMALENFVEMRDHTAHRAFHYKKQLEQFLHAKFPTLLTPQYSLISFSTVPYAEARRRGRNVDLLVRAVFTLGLSLGALVLLRGVLRVPVPLSVLLALLASWQTVQAVLPRASVKQTLPRARL